MVSLLVSMSVQENYSLKYYLELNVLRNDTYASSGLEVLVHQEFWSTGCCYFPVYLIHLCTPRKFSAL